MCNHNKIGTVTHGSPVSTVAYRTCRHKCSHVYKSHGNSFNFFFNVGRLMCFLTDKATELQQQRFNLPTIISLHWDNKDIFYLKLGGNPRGGVSESFYGMVVCCWGFCYFSEILASGSIRSMIWRHNTFFFLHPLWQLFFFFFKIFRSFQRLLHSFSIKSYSSLNLRRLVWLWTCPLCQRSPKPALQTFLYCLAH